MEILGIKLLILFAIAVFTLTSTILFIFDEEMDNHIWLIPFGVFGLTCYAIIRVLNLIYQL